VTGLFVFVAVDFHVCTNNYNFGLG